MLISSGIFSYSHGTNDAQKTMGIIAVVLYGTIWSNREFQVPFWVVLLCHAAMGLGTALGVKFAHPGRTIIMLIGDGSFYYNPVPAAFGACQEHGLPMLVVLFDNAGYFSQKSDVVREYPQGWAVRSNKFVGTSITPMPDYPMLAKAFGGARIFLKREDLAHTGAHKINNALGQALLAVRMGKRRIVAETGAGQHGVATATACAWPYSRGRLSPSRCGSAASRRPRKAR